MVHACGRTLLRRGCLGLHLVWADERILGLTDKRTDRGQRHLLLVDVELVHDGAHQAARVIVIIDGEVGTIAHQLRVLAQHAHTHGMEGARPHATRATGQQATKALAHLCRCFIRKCDGKHLPRPHALMGDHVGDAVREHARLARPSPGKYQQGPRGTQHRLVLGLIEAIEVYVCGKVLRPLGRSRDVISRSLRRHIGWHGLERKKLLLTVRHGTPVLATKRTQSYQYASGTKRPVCHPVTSRATLKTHPRPGAAPQPDGVDASARSMQESW